MINFKSPIVIAIILIIVVIVSVSMGKSQWFKNLLNTNSNTDGRPCTFSTNPFKGGNFKNGICIAENP